MSDMHQFGGDDEEMYAAMEEARQRLPELQHALDEDARRLIPIIDGAIVKARFESIITHSIEHMWVEDVAFEDDQIVGTLANEPNNIPELAKGDVVTISPENVSDWAYRQKGRTFGGFTIAVMKRRGMDI
jgi:uncharacterized protein YegJ (DUF2314 family)